MTGQSGSLPKQKFVTTDTSAPAPSRYSVAMSSRAVAQTKPTTVERFAPVRSVVDQAIEQRAFPGAAWGVLHQGAIIALDTAGRFTYEADAPAMQPETVFDLASVTKVMATTAAAMLLVDRGLFDLVRQRLEAGEINDDVKTGPLP